MFIMLGDEVTVTREIGGQSTWVTGRVSGIVQKENGDLNYFYIRGLDSALWLSDGWSFAEDIEEGEEDNA